MTEIWRISLPTFSGLDGWLETDPLRSHGTLITRIPRNIFSVSEECVSYLLFSNRSAVRMLLLQKSQVKDVRAGLDPQTDTNNLQNMGQDQGGGPGRRTRKEGLGGGPEREDLGGDSEPTTGSWFYYLLSNTYVNAQIVDND